MKSYTNEVIKLIQPHLEYSRKTVIHVHTLNLMELALSLKGILPDSKIVTHLHCIPWKGYVNSNIYLFNRLYQKYYMEGDWEVYQYLTHHSELNAYTQSDRVVCLTESAREFLTRICPNVKDRIWLIPNGLVDLGRDFNRPYKTEGELRLVYAGALSPGKGLTYILDALLQLEESGTSVSLDVAGFPSPRVEKLVREKYSTLNVTLRGVLPREELMELYKVAHVGIIASLQEQCSYVALEMCMMGLPIVTTAIDGLDEIFEHGTNALKVPVTFSRSRGLTPDVNSMTQHIATLAGDESLRQKLGLNARELYLRLYTLEKMVLATENLYLEVLNERRT